MGEHLLVSQSMSTTRLDIYVRSLVVLIAWDTVRCSTMVGSDLRCKYWTPFKIAKKTWCLLCTLQYFSQAVLKASAVFTAIIRINHGGAPYGVSIYEQYIFIYVCVCVCVCVYNTLQCFSLANLMASPVFTTIIRANQGGSTF
jgi:hypothetical protein